MTINEIRTFTQETITALHEAGWHDEAFSLGNDLHGIGYQPSMADALMVLDDAERLAEALAEPAETWASHPSLTAEQRNPTLR
jgi:hypothetical protein